MDIDYLVSQVRRFKEYNNLFTQREDVYCVILC